MLCYHGALQVNHVSAAGQQGSKAAQLLKELVQLLGLALEVTHGQISLSKSSAFSAMSYGVSQAQLCGI